MDMGWRRGGKAGGGTHRDKTLSGTKPGLSRNSKEAHRVSIKRGWERGKRVKTGPMIESHIGHGRISSFIK